MEIRRYSDDRAYGCAAAARIAELIRHNPAGLYCVAAGTTSIPVFDALLAMRDRGEVSFSEASFMGMDEWLGLPQNADGAMAAFLRQHFLDRAGFRDVFLFDGAADPQGEVDRAESFIKEKGGLECILFGIGVNGHVALNEPGCDPSLRTHIAEIQTVTATVAQKYFSGKAPVLSKGVTLGLQNAREARHIFLTANTPNKRPAMENILQRVSSGRADTSVPAAVIALMPQTEFFITDSVMA